MNRVIDGIDLDGLEFMSTNTAMARVVTGDLVPFDEYDWARNGFSNPYTKTNLGVVADTSHFTDEMLRQIGYTKEVKTFSPIPVPDALGEATRGRGLENARGAMSLMRDAVKFATMPDKVKTMVNPVANSVRFASLAIGVVNAADDLGLLRGLSMAGKRDLANYVLDGRLPDKAIPPQAQYISRMGKWLYENRDQLLKDQQLLSPSGNILQLNKRTNDEFKKLYTAFPEGSMIEQVRARVSAIMQDLRALRVRGMLPSVGNRGRDAVAPADAVKPNQ
jgi:hypothetical protein